MHAPAFPPIPIETLLLAYRSGIFPMADGRDDPELFWVEPKERAVVPLDGFKASKTLRKVLRQDRFRVTIDTAFTDVVSLCAAPRPDNPESWISWRIAASYRALHEAGHAHSIECWAMDETDADDPGLTGREVLVGGLYGVAFDRVFCGESMFSRADNASKVALAWLVTLMRQAGYALLDCQFMTDHLASLGAIEMPQALYLERLAAARGSPDMTLPEAYASFVSGAGVSEDGASVSSSPGKRIAQSLIQTS